MQAARMMISNKPELSNEIQTQHSVLSFSKYTTFNLASSFNIIQLNFKDESEEIKALKKILITLGFSKPPPNVTATEIWSKIEAKVF